jgi:Dolichol-phosphate mannosyltransferase subunit 3 (DPM3)
MTLLRYQIFLSYTAALFAFWAIALGSNGGFDHFQLKTSTDIVLVFIPVWGLITLGIYLLSLLIYGVMTYRDCPEAARELESEIKEAKTEMKRRGIIQ